MTTAYWIGDLCYVMGDVWNEVCNLTFPASGGEVKGELRLKDGRQFTIQGTAYGDGSYDATVPFKFGVDSGTLGAVRLADITDPEATLRLGFVKDFPPGQMTSSFEDGTVIFTCGGETVQIFTGDQEEEEEFEELYEEDDTEWA